jgi:arabinose-5-phosphate isomerase
MQMAAIEFARHVCGIKDATSREFVGDKKSARNLVIDIMEEQKNIRDMGGTMRLGSYPCKIVKGTRTYEAYDQVLIHERHRHRYEFNNKFKALFEKKGLTMSGICEDRDLVEIIEITEHPWFVGVQFHPEFKSKPLAPHPLFKRFVAASWDHKKKVLDKTLSSRSKSSGGSPRRMARDRSTTVYIMSADVEEGRRVLKIEAQSLLDIAERLNGSFEKAVELVMACKGKVIVTGIGKSGQVARKMASTLSSTGTPALYLHPAESSHGDMGVISSGDLVIAFSYGGESPEFLPLLNYVTRHGVPLIGFTARNESALAKHAGVVLDIAVKEEACPLGLAPTSSSTASLGLADALAMAVLRRRGFRKEDFAEFHPGGSLGRKLTLRVRDVMHKGEALPLVHPDESMTRVISLMTSKDVRGVAGVIDKNAALIGIITDGDIRRRLEKSSNPLTEKAEDVMSKNPKTIDCNELAEKAAFLMEQFRIDRLFAIDRSAANGQSPVGLIHFQDLLRAGIR